MWKLDKMTIPLTALFVIGLAAAAAASEVTVIRGSDIQTVTAGQGTPTVLRGGGSMIPPVSAPRTARAGRADSPRIAAGRTLWLVDGNRRRITACTLRGTATLDRRRIICTRY